VTTPNRIRCSARAAVGSSDRKRRAREVGVRADPRGRSRAERLRRALRPRLGRSEALFGLCGAVRVSSLLLLWLLLRSRVLLLLLSLLRSKLSLVSVLLAVLSPWRILSLSEILFLLRV
jgi:hypothetical protein